jgi:putative ABC transport system permease protein
MRTRLRRGRLRVAVALNEIRRGGVRVALAIGAVAVGIAATTSMLALDAGVRSAIDEIAAGSGRRVLTVVAGRVDAPPGRGVGSFASTRLGRDDVVALQADLDGERRVAPIAERPARVKLGGREALTSVRGVTPAYFELRGFAAAHGRLSDDLDGEALARVAVVGSLVAAKLGGRVLGESVSIDGVPFTVIGGSRARAWPPTARPRRPDPGAAQTAERRLFNVGFLSAALIESPVATTTRGFETTFVRCCGVVTGSMSRRATTSTSSLRSRRRDSTWAGRSSSVFCARCLRHHHDRRSCCARRDT